MAMNSRKYSAHLLQARNDHLQTTRRSKSCRIEGFRGKGQQKTPSSTSTCIPAGGRCACPNSRIRQARAPSPQERRAFSFSKET
jgi:hypothetical protein